MLKFLFPKDEKAVDPVADQTRIARTGKALAGFLNGRFLRAFIVQNRGWFAVGAGLTLAVWLATALVVVDPETVLVEAGLTALATLAVLATAVVAARRWRRVFGGSLRVLPAALAVTIATLVFGAVWLVLGLALMIDVGFAASAALVASVAVNLLFFRLLPRPTTAGRAALDEIAGTRLYLTVAEADRLKFHNPPDRTPEHFCAMLPYAVALGVETAWTSQFAAIMAGATTASAMPQPDWYSGSGWSGGGWRQVGSGLSRSIASAEAAGLQAMAAARAAASGSGAAFGGGFSGGGGGSSGGGGW